MFISHQSFKSQVSHSRPTLSKSLFLLVFFFFCIYIYFSLWHGIWHNYVGQKLFIDTQGSRKQQRNLHNFTLLLQPLPPLAAQQLLIIVLAKRGGGGGGQWVGDRGQVAYKNIWKGSLARVRERAGHIFLHLLFGNWDIKENCGKKKRIWGKRIKGEKCENIVRAKCVSLTCSALNLCVLIKFWVGFFQLISSPRSHPHPFVKHEFSTFRFWYYFAHNSNRNAWRAGGTGQTCFENRNRIFHGSEIQSRNAPGGSGKKLSPGVN